MSRAGRHPAAYVADVKEPRFSDAPCYGKEFDAKSKICRVCLGRDSCQRILYKTIGGMRLRLDPRDTAKGLLLPLKPSPALPAASSLL